VQDALQTGELSDPLLRGFVSSLLTAFRKGEVFQHDMAVAAIAVALERETTPFAEEYLRDLARLQAAEMSMSIRVARECLNQRHATLTGSPVSRMEMKTDAATTPGRDPAPTDL
jgi:hypothetical protein